MNDLNLKDMRENAKKIWIPNRKNVALKYRLILKGLPIFDMSDDKDNDRIEISFAQMRYRRIGKKSQELKPEVKTRWLIDRVTRKREVPINECMWTFIPFAIVHKKRSMEPPDQRFIYLMQIRQSPVPNDCNRAANRNVRDGAVEYFACIQTSLDGTVVSRQFDPRLPHSELPYKFAFPKRFVSKMNRCLLDNYWQDLRSKREPDCFAWHKTDEGRVWYLADRGENIDPSYTDKLMDLLSSQSGDATAVLLAYTCFSILKDFFPQYHVLDKNTPYLTAKKYMPTQFALNLCSTNCDAAEYLAAFFCKPFQEAAWPKTTTAGVQVQSCKKGYKYPTLSVMEFESKILQPASVLWINRDPADKLIREEQIITLQVSGSVKKNSNDSIGTNLVYALTRVIHNVIETNQESYWKACWQLSKPIINETLKNINYQAQKCQYPIIDIDFGWGNEVLRKDNACLMPYSILKLARHLERCFYDDINDYVYDTVRERPEVDEFESVVQSEFKTCRRKIKKAIQKIENIFFSLDPDYRETLSKMEHEAGKYRINQQILKNISYLSVSARFYIRNCIPSQYQAAISLQVDNALKKLYLSEQTQDAKKLIENCILALIKANRYARIRGEGSDRGDIGVWYDPHTAEFYLPAKTFFDDMVRTLNLQSYPKRWTLEKDLMHHGILRAQEDGRKTWQIIAVRGGKRRTVLKIFFENFLAKHASDITVYSAISAMTADSTPFR